MTLRLNGSTSGYVEIDSPAVGNNVLITLPNTASTLANTTQLGPRNKLINGSFDIWQRATSGTTGYVADRWLTGSTSSVTRSTDTPNSKYRYSFEFASNSATYPYLDQRIESFNATSLIGDYATLSFWAKNVTGTSTLYVEFYYANSQDNFGAQTIIGSAITVAASPSSSWTQYTATTTVPIPANAANGICVRIVRNNNAASTTRITGVQFETGMSASPYEFEDYSIILNKCQRYFQKYDWAAGAGVTVGMVYPTNNVHSVIPLVTQMRTSPASGNVSTSGTFYGLDASNTGRGVSAITINTCSPTTIALDFTGLFNLGAGYACFIGASTACSMSVNAEL